LKRDARKENLKKKHRSRVLGKKGISLRKDEKNGG
jgi:hypothetical protein